MKRKQRRIGGGCKHSADVNGRSGTYLAGSRSPVLRSVEECEGRGILTTRAGARSKSRLRNINFIRASRRRNPPESQYKQNCSPNCSIDTHEWIAQVQERCRLRRLRELEIPAGGVQGSAVIPITFPSFERNICSIVKKLHRSNLTIDLGEAYCGSIPCELAACRERGSAQPSEQVSVLLQ